MSTGKSKPPQGGGELSGLLRHAEILQKEVDKALQGLENEAVVGQDAARRVTLEIAGNGEPRSVKVDLPGLPPEHAKALEEATLMALRTGLEQLFELRRQKAGSVTKGLQLPGLFL